MLLLVLMVMRRRSSRMTVGECWDGRMEVMAGDETEIILPINFF
jgi:hypothetical protein